MLRHGRHVAGEFTHQLRVTSCPVPLRRDSNPREESGLAKSDPAPVTSLLAPLAVPAGKEPHRAGEAGLARLGPRKWNAARSRGLLQEPRVKVGVVGDHEPAGKQALQRFFDVLEEWRAC